jgi:hypothetical protein
MRQTGATRRQFFYCTDHVRTIPEESVQLPKEAHATPLSPPVNGDGSSPVEEILQAGSVGLEVAS